MGIFDELHFISRLKAGWDQAKARDQLNSFLDSMTYEADLARDPAYIVSNIIKDVKKIAVDGVKLGGSVDSIPKDKTREIQKSSWPATSFYHCTNGATYKVIAGMVVDFFLTGELLTKTGLLREEDVLRAFGKPNKIKKIRNGPVLLVNIYIYKKRHIAVEVDAGGEVVRINIFK